MAVVPLTELCGKFTARGMLLFVVSFISGSAQNPLPPQLVSPAAATHPNLPPTAPTTPRAAPAVRVAPSDLPEGAQVRWNGNQLAIVANNSSLSQILRDVARQTGMKVTGAIVDERVFGSYGPAPVTQVLTALLDGTGANLLMLEGEHSSVRVLVLTPRGGGPRFQDLANGNNSSGLTDLPPQLPRHPAGSLPTLINPETQSDGGSQGQVPGFASEPSPNGVKTPQQMYEEIVRARQQSLINEAAFPPGQQIPEAQADPGVPSYPEVQPYPQPEPVPDPPVQEDPQPQ